MMRRFSWVLGLFLAIWLGGPTHAVAATPKVEVHFEGMNLTTGSGWQDAVKAKQGDAIRFRSTLVNTEPGTVVNDVNVEVGLFTSQVVNQTPHFHIRANNVIVPDEGVEVEIENGYVMMEYVAGSGTLQVGGTTSKLSPDSATDNVTVREVHIGNVSSGTGNAVVVTFEVKVTTRPTILLSGNVTTSQSSTASGGAAVAKQAPKTGVEDFVPLEALKWLSMGVFGFGLKRVARSILKM